MEDENNGRRMEVESQSQAHVLIFVKGMGVEKERNEKRQQQASIIMAHSCNGQLGGRVVNARGCKRHDPLHPPKLLANDHEGKDGVRR